MADPNNKAIFTETGALFPRPVTVRFGAIKVLLTVFPFVYTGAFISRKFASLLEKFEIFIPPDPED